MATRREASIRTIQPHERDIDIALAQKLIEHRRHQSRVGTITKLGRQDFAHAKYSVRLAHYLEQPRDLTPDRVASPRGTHRWLTRLIACDFRAYQSRLAGIDIAEADAYFWWFRLGDEQRYSLIRVGAGAARDEHEQEKRYRGIERRRKQREEDGW